MQPYCIMGYNTINIDCNIISGFKDNGNNSDIIYTHSIELSHQVI